MNLLSRYLAFAIFASSFSQVAEAQQNFNLDAGLREKLESSLKSSDIKNQTRAIYTCYLLEPAGLKNVEPIFHSARLHHEKRLAQQLQQIYGEHQEQATKLDAERKRIYELLMIDYKKDPSKIAMLKREMKSLESPNKRLNRIASKNTDAAHAAAIQIVDQLRAINYFLYACNEGMGCADETWLPSNQNLDLEEERETVIRSISGGELYEAAIKRLQKTRDEIASYDAVEKAQKELDSWATGPMKQFASILNSQRVLLGLRPLLLEEKICSAAFGHSDDMRRLNFFDHVSPVPGKAGPGDRAAAAGYAGQWTGENIFMGSTDPQAAYNGWFGSDGHRFIMMADSPDQLGVGISESHWTMLGGRSK